MNKTDLIKALYEQGKITFDEAMTLASKESAYNKDDMSLIEGAQESKESRVKRQVEDLIYKMTVVNIDPDLGENYAFDIEKIVKFMNDNDWMWRGEKVTEDMFREDLQNYLREVVEKTVDDYVSGRYKDEPENEMYYPGHHSTDSGGIEVASWINTDCNIIEVEAKFVAEQAFESIELKDLK